MQFVAPPGGGWGTLIISYMRRFGSFFGFEIFNFNIFWGFQKNKYIFGYEDFVDIFFFLGGGGGHHKIGLYLGVISSCIIPHKPMKSDERYAMTSSLRKYIAGYTVTNF